MVVTTVVFPLSSVWSPLGRAERTEAKTSNKQNKIKNRFIKIPLKKIKPVSKPGREKNAVLHLGFQKFPQVFILTFRVMEVAAAKPEKKNFENSTAVPKKRIAAPSRI